MTTEQLLAIIGEEIENAIIKHRFGDATLHANGFITCDPCYVFNHDESQQPGGFNYEHHAAYPWNSYDYTANRAEWRSWEWRGKTCYARDCSDGVGYFGHSVDSGWVAAIPLELCPNEIQGKFSVTMR